MEGCFLAENVILSEIIVENGHCFQLIKGTISTNK